MKSTAIIGAVKGVTEKWAKQRKREERNASAQLNRRLAMVRYPHVSIRDAAWSVMEGAYRKASSNGTLPAHARQIMYAARPEVQRRADRELGSDFDKYFTQTLLPDYINSYGVDWNVVFDARGHLWEPHVLNALPLGTIEVRSYIATTRLFKIPELDLTLRDSGFPTAGPSNRYGAILFIEKEGFMPLFKHVRLAERYDLAIMSTKGMSVTAAREFIDAVCAESGIPLLVLHDFDVSGFSIAGTLTGDTRRYRFRNQINVTDLGLRLSDLQGLDSEEVYISSPLKIEETLRRHGASKEEIEFLLSGRRVELNALTSADLVAMVERKLIECGVAKVVPADETLARAYQRMHRQAVVQAKITELLSDLGECDAPVPPDLADRVREIISDHPATAWDVAVKQIVRKAKL